MKKKEKREGEKKRNKRKKKTQRRRCKRGSKKEIEASGEETGERTKSASGACFKYFISACVGKATRTLPRSLSGVRYFPFIDTYVRTRPPIKFGRHTVCAPPEEKGSLWRRSFDREKSRQKKKKKKNGGKKEKKEEVRRHDNAPRPTPFTFRFIPGTDTLIE